MHEDKSEILKEVLRIKKEIFGLNNSVSDKVSLLRNNIQERENFISNDFFTPEGNDIILSLCSSKHVFITPTLTVDIFTETKHGDIERTSRTVLPKAVASFGAFVDQVKNETCVNTDPNTPIYYFIHNLTINEHGVKIVYFNKLATNQKLVDVC
jgi:hypothetical protein